MFEDNDKNDFYENSDSEPVREEPKRPVYTSDDPRYWDEPEDEFEHLRPAGGVENKFWIWLGVAAVAIGILWGLYLHFFNPYIEQAAQYGYIEKIDKEGEVFKTFEGVLLPYKSLMDTTRAYEGDFHFSTTDDKVAARLFEAEYAHEPVRVSYKVYHTPLPWRGKANVVVTAVDSVNARDLLPPDRRPEIHAE